MFKPYMDHRNCTVVNLDYKVSCDITVILQKCIQYAGFNKIGCFRYAERCFGGGSGIFLIMFSWAIGMAMIDHHFGLTH